MAQQLNAAMWKQLLQRSARENMSLQGQIREMLVAAILDGQLPRRRADPVEPRDGRAAGRGAQHGRAGLPAAGRRGLPGLAPAQRPLRQRGDAGRPAGARQRRAGSRGRGRRRARLAAPLPRAAVARSATSSSRPTGRSTRIRSSTASSTPRCSRPPTGASAASRALSVLDIRDWAPDQIARDDESLVQQIRTRVLPRRGVWAVGRRGRHHHGRAARAVHGGRPADARRTRASASRTRAIPMRATSSPAARRS